MTVDVKVPGIGESVQEGMIESWHQDHQPIQHQDDHRLPFKEWYDWFGHPRYKI